MAKPSGAKSPFETDHGVLEQLLEAHAWVKAHSRSVISGTVAVGLLLAAGLYYRNYVHDLQASALVELERVRETVAGGNTSLAINDLQRFLAQYGSTKAAREARVMLATELLRVNRPQEAIETVSDLTQKPRESPLAARAALLTGAALEAQGDTAAAIQHYLRVADQMPMDYLKQDALSSAARLQALRGDYAAAAATYKRLRELVPEESVERPLYELRGAEMEARARVAESGA